MYQQVYDPIHETIRYLSDMSEEQLADKEFIASLAGLVGPYCFIFCFYSVFAFSFPPFLFFFSIGK